MKLGFASMNNPEDLRADLLAVALEERGFDSLWIGEHPHVPVARAEPYPLADELPVQYTRMMDPFISLTLAAAATRSLLLGTGVVLPLEHDLFTLAKAVATLDLVSEGRVLFGVGVGWIREELENVSSVPWRSRYLALSDCVAALKTLWRDDEAEHHGTFFDFEPVWSNPKPLQRPHPPVICGANGRLGTRHAVAWADGWMPMDVALGDVDKKVHRFREVTREAAREPIPITISAIGDPSPETLTHYRDLGVDRVVIGAGRSGWGDAESTLPFLDRYAPLITELT
jgi:probable F420-dependent oxidoreductase